MEQKQTGKEKKKKKTWRLKKRIRMQLLAIAVLVLLFMTVSSFAWYTFRAREAWSQERQVMEPYCLYLRDEQDQESAKLSVDNLSSGEIKEIPFCVSNAPNSGIVMGGGEFDFQLELIHTENLPLTYKIYELEQVDMSKDSVFEDETAIRKPVSGTEVTEIRHKEAFLDVDVTDVVNKGKYWLYEKEGAAAGVDEADLKQLHLSTGVDAFGQTTYTTRCFLLQISFPKIDNFQQYNKETDVIYLTATAKQPRPVK